MDNMEEDYGTWKPLDFRARSSAGTLYPMPPLTAAMRKQVDGFSLLVPPPSGEGSNITADPPTVTPFRSLGESNLPEARQLSREFEEMHRIFEEDIVGANAGKKPTDVRFEDDGGFTEEKVPDNVTVRNKGRRQYSEETERWAADLKSLLAEVRGVATDVQAQSQTTRDTSLDSVAVGPPTPPRMSSTPTGTHYGDRETESGTTIELRSEDADNIGSAV